MSIRVVSYINQYEKTVLFIDNVTGLVDVRAGRAGTLPTSRVYTGIPFGPVYRYTI